MGVEVGPKEFVELLEDAITHLKAVDLALKRRVIFEIPGHYAPAESKVMQCWRGFS